MPIAYCPPLMLIGAAALIPEMVMVAEVRFALSAAPVTAVKLKALGVVSCARLLTELLLMALLTALRVLLAVLIARLLTELGVITLLTTLLVVLAELLATWPSSPALDTAMLDATTLLIAVRPLDFLPPLPPPHAVNTATNPKIKSL